MMDESEEGTHGKGVFGSHTQKEARRLQLSSLTSSQARATVEHPD
jgi:hypothetical protein